jgi:hypothetical protein
VLSVTIDRVWTGNWIYWTFTLVTTSNSDSLTEIHTPKITVTTAPIQTSNDRHSPSSGFLNSSQPQPSASHFSQLHPSTDLTNNSSQSRSHIVTDGQSASLGVEPHLGLMTRYLLLFDSYGLVIVGHPL